MPNISPDDIEKHLERIFRSGFFAAKKLVSLLHQEMIRYISTNPIPVEQLQKIILGILDGIFAPRQLLKQVS